jgi:hypothetical protein
LIKNEISTEPTLGLCESNPWLPLCIVYDCYNQPCSLTNNEVSKQLVDKYNPLLRSQALESGNEHEKIVNYIITLANESNSNLTRMTEVSLNTLTEMGGITPEEREQLMPIISEATTNDTEITTGDIQALQNNASELLKELYENYASLEAISIASVLNNSISLTTKNAIPISDVPSVLGWDVLCGVTGAIWLGVPGFGASGYCSAESALGHI